MSEMVQTHISLSPEAPQSEPVVAEYLKQPIHLEPGNYYNGRVFIDENPSPLMESMGEQARELRELPDIERLQPLMTLLREQVSYPYAEVVASLRETDPDRAQWIESRISPEANEPLVTLSEIFEGQYAQCGQLSVAYLWLAQEAGLKGVLLNDIGDIINVTNPDTGKPLFKMAELGGKLPAHGWVEIQTENGWASVDPSTHLVGDAPEKARAFHDANYLAIQSVDLVTVDGAEGVKGYSRVVPMSPQADTVRVEGMAGLLPRRMKFGLGNIEDSEVSVVEPTITHYEGDVTLQFGAQHVGSVALKFVDFVETNE